jgi:hypothetical protein
MANDTTYNGWTNYETWVVNLWIDNDEDTQNRWSERAAELVQEAIDADSDDIRDSAASTLADEIESEYDDEAPEVAGAFTDLLRHALGMVDWREIADHYVNDVDVFSTGWNMPGFMPDNPPATFTDCSSAREYISEQMDREAEAAENDVAEDDHYSAKTSELETASLEVLKGSGEYGATVAGTHYFVTRI